MRSEAWTLRDWIVLVALVAINVALLAYRVTW